MKLALGSKLRASLACGLLVVGACVFSSEGAVAASGSDSSFTWASADVFAGALFSTQSGSRKGSSGIGGAHWTPAIGISSSMDIKGLFGAFAVNSSNEKIHAAFDYVAMFRYHMDSIIFGLGAGGVTFAFPGSAVTNMQARGSLEYSLGTALLGFIDRLHLSSGYVFGVKSAPSFIFVNAGLGMDF